MNNLKKLGIILLTLLTLCFGCSTECCLYKTSAKIYLINQSSSVVKSVYDRCFEYEIQPGDTLIHNESFEGEYSKRPTAKTYQPFQTCYLFKYLSNSKCEVGLRDIENFDNVKELSDLNFELTYRFTDEKKENAELCN